MKVGANPAVNQNMHISAAMLSKIQTRDNTGDDSDEEDVYSHGGGDGGGSTSHAAPAADPNAMKFRFLKKSKGKLQAVSLAVPGQAAVAERIKKYADTERAERDEIKNFVLNYNEQVGVFLLLVLCRRYLLHVARHPWVCVSRLL